MSSRIPVPCFGRFIFSTHTIFDCITLGYCKICSLFLRMFSSLTLISGCRIDLVLKSVLIPVCGLLEGGRASSTKLSSLYFLCISSSLFLVIIIMFSFEEQLPHCSIFWISCSLFLQLMVGTTAYQL